MQIRLQNYYSDVLDIITDFSQTKILKKGGGIHIKKKNRGKFTTYCGGKVTDECIRRAKASGNPTLVKRATFAANARKWKHKDGGLIQKLGGGPGMSSEQEANIFWKLNGKYIYNKLKAAGITNKLIISGLFGNIAQESGFRHNAKNGRYSGFIQNEPKIVNWITKRYGGYNKDHLIQFMIDGLSGRLKANKGDSIGTMLVQRFNNFNNSVKTARTPEEVAYLWEKHYEKSGGQGNSRRKKFAKIFHNGMLSGQYSYNMINLFPIDFYDINNLNNYTI